jgi:hypothetical protein
MGMSADSPMIFQATYCRVYSYERVATEMPYRFAATFFGDSGEQPNGGGGISMREYTDFSMKEQDY